MDVQNGPFTPGDLFPELVAAFTAQNNLAPRVSQILFCSFGWNTARLSYGPVSPEFA